MAQWSSVPTRRSLRQFVAGKDDVAKPDEERMALVQYGPFIDRGIEIQQLQSVFRSITSIHPILMRRYLRRKLKSLVKFHHEHPLKTTADQIVRTTTRLEQWLSSWREVQRQCMPEVDLEPGQPDVPQSADMHQEGESDREWVDHGSADACLEDELLGLPSDLRADQRNSPAMSDMVSTECAFRIGEVNDLLKEIRKTVKHLGILEHDKVVHTRGQDQNTRANNQIRDHIRERDLLIAHYNASRQALISLGEGDDAIAQSYPVLTVKDTFRKWPEARRQIGDSRRLDAKLWTTAGLAPIPTDTEGLLMRTDPPNVDQVNQADQRDIAQVTAAISRRKVGK
jgi:hypothetical protein